MSHQQRSFHKICIWNNNLNKVRCRRTVVQSSQTLSTKPSNGSISFPRQIGIPQRYEDLLPKEIAHTFIVKTTLSFLDKRERYEIDTRQCLLCKK